jgi:hypothetical protein
MDKRKTLSSGYLLNEVFEDIYDYEEYFQLINDIDVRDLCPSEIDIVVTTKVKSVRLRFPEDDPKLIEVLVPRYRNSKQSAKKTAEVRERYFKKYASIVPKVKIEIKDVLAMKRKILVSDKEEVYIGEKIKKKRASGLKKVIRNSK